MTKFPITVCLKTIFRIGKKRTMLPQQSFKWLCLQAMSKLQTTTILTNYFEIVRRSEKWKLNFRRVNEPGFGQLTCFASIHAFTEIEDKVPSCSASIVDFPQAYFIPGCDIQMKEGRVIRRNSIRTLSSRLKPVYLTRLIK